MRVLVPFESAEEPGSMIYLDPDDVSRLTPAKFGGLGFTVIHFKMGPPVSVKDDAKAAHDKLFPVKPPATA